MTTSHQDYINGLITNHRYSEAYTLFANSNLTSIDLLQLYKKHNKNPPRLFDQVAFWKSELPLLYLKELFESGLKSNFLHKYFSNNEHANDQLNTCLFLNFEFDFIRYFKFNCSFLLKAFRESLIRVSTNIPELKRLCAEGQLLFEESELLDKKQTEDDNLLLQLNLDEILMGLVLNYERGKKSPEMLGNKAWQFKIENVLIELVHHVLLLKNESDALKVFPSNEKIQEEFDRYKSTANNHGLIIPLDGVQSMIFDIVNRYIQITSQKNKIELYQCEYADLESIVLKPLRITPNEEFDRFQSNDYKKGVEESYFLGNTLDNLTIDPMRRASIRSDLKMFEFYGIPTIINIENDLVDLEKTMTLLQYFSVFKGPLEKTALSNKADQLFFDYFGGNESVTIFNENKLKSGIVKYFDWPEMEVEYLLEFLTFDLVQNELPHLWVHRPFLKIGEQVIWLGTFLKDRRWSNILLNKMKKECKRSLINEIAVNLEKKVEKVFQEAGFVTTQGMKYPPKGETQGDLDVVALKDNYLFICEVKSGERSHDFSYAAQREMVKLEEKAAGQIKRATDNTNLYINELRKKLDCQIDLDAVTIIPMIVTDTFEGDQYFTDGNIRKVSLLEIDVILKNKKRELLEMYFITESMTNRRKFRVKTDTEWDLWNGSDSLSCERFLEIIDNNEVWNDFLEEPN